MIVSPEGLKLALRDVDRHTLFDLRKDPTESTNLFDHPDYLIEQRRLTSALREGQKRTKDPLVLA